MSPDLIIVELQSYNYVSTLIICRRSVYNIICYSQCYGSRIRNLKTNYRRRSVARHNKMCVYIAASVELTSVPCHVDILARACILIHIVPAAIALYTGAERVRLVIGRQCFCRGYGYSCHRLYDDSRRCDA